MTPSSTAEIKRLLTIYPDDTLLLTSLGTEYLKKEKYSEAIRVFQRIVELDPTYSVSYRYLAESYQKNSQVPEAVRTYRKGIDIARQQGDLQTAKEMAVFLRRIEKPK